MSNAPYIYPTNVLEAIVKERRRQEILRLDGIHPWTCATVGVPDHLKLVILAEEFGEVAHLVGDDLSLGKLSRAEYVNKLRGELVQVAAVATAWVEAIDGRGKHMNEHTTVSVEAWACGMCAHVHGAKENADDCCKCTTCGEKFEHEASYNNTCDSCMYGARLRDTRKDVTREAEDLRRAIARLRELVANPPKGKKAPKKGIADDIVALEPMLQDLHVRLTRFDTEGA